VREGDPRCAELWLKYVEKFQPSGQRPVEGERDVMSEQISEERKAQILNAFGNFGVLEPPKKDKEKIS